MWKKGMGDHGLEEGRAQAVRSERYGRPDQCPGQSFRVGCGKRGDLIGPML